MAFIFNSCKKKNINKSDYDKEKVTDVSSTSNNLSFSLKEASFDYLKIKTKVNLNSDKISQRVPANIIIKKDSLIWISVSVGIEAARAIVNKDGIIALNRLGKEYYKMSFDQISKDLSFPIDYSLIEGLITGNLPIPLQKDVKLMVEGNTLIAINKLNKYKIVDKMDLSNQKLVSIEAKSEENDINLGINFSDFEIETSQLFPLNILFSLEDSKKKVTSLEFNHNTIEVSTRPLKMPFSIPDSYSESKVSF